METLKLGGIDCRIIRSPKRRRISIRIADDGIPEISVPAFISLAEVQLVGEKHLRWIVKHSEERLRLNTQQSAFILDYGSHVRCLGGTRQLIATNQKAPGFDNSAFYVPSGLDSTELRTVVTDIYQRVAREYIPARCAAFADTMRLNPKSVKINAAKSHWAVCSARATLNFTWYTIMAKPSAIDYIIVHELCHLLEFNHSSRFWELVGQHCPDYSLHKDYLRSLWREIVAEGWV